MRARIVVNVTPEDRRQLEAIVGDRNAPQKPGSSNALDGPNVGEGGRCELAIGAADSGGPSTRDEGSNRAFGPAVGWDAPTSFVCPPAS